MDFVGPLTTSTGKKYLLTAVDHFTKYAEAYVVPDCSAETVSRCLVNRYIPVHGVPDRLITDRGTAFTSTIIQSLCRTWGARKIQTTAYHPQSNGVCKRFHRTLANIIAKVTKTTKSWEAAIPVALAAYRATPHSSTGYTPNYLTFGREVKLPNSVEWNTPEGIINPLARLEEVRRLAAHCLKKEWEARARCINQRRTPRTFEVGDRVYLRMMQFPPSECKKFWSPWTGPWTVIDRASDVTYKIVDVLGRHEQTVHINRLKPTHEKGIPDDALLIVPHDEPNDTENVPPVQRPEPRSSEEEELWDIDDPDHQNSRTDRKHKVAHTSTPDPKRRAPLAETNIKMEIQTPIELTPGSSAEAQNVTNPYHLRPRTSIDYRNLSTKGIQEE